MKINSILVEGIDGAGKTSVATWLANHLNMVYHRIPIGNFKTCSHLFNADQVSLQERFSFYAGANIYTSMTVSQMVADGKRVVLDRYFPSTICYHDLTGEIPDQYENIFRSLMRPDLVLFINTEYETILSRLANRDFSPNDKIFLTLANFNKINVSYKDIFDQFSLNYVQIHNGSDFETTKQIILDTLATQENE
jgi:thymidylate kinase